VGRFRPWSTLHEALDIASNQPVLWLLGAAGFLLRGGFIVLLLALVSLPSPVQVRLLIGDGLGSAGFSGGLVAVAAGVGIVTAALLLGSMWAVANLEVASFERGHVAQLGAARLDRHARRRAASWIFVAQALAFLLIGAAALPLIAGATTVAYQEIVRPSGDGPLYTRIVAGVEPQLLLLAVAILVAEALSAVGTRAALRRASGLSAPAHRARWRPLVAGIGWMISLGVLVPALWSLAVVWHWVSGALLGVSGSSAAGLAVAVAISVLAGVWASVVTLAGFASALRGALWTVQELR
jgi:hypothetical protein